MVCSHSSLKTWASSANVQCFDSQSFLGLVVATHLSSVTEAIFADLAVIRQAGDRPLRNVAARQGRYTAPPGAPLWTILA